jgi:hypothetical protein
MIPPITSVSRSILTNLNGFRGNAEIRQFQERYTCFQKKKP